MRDFFEQTNPKMKESAKILTVIMVIIFGFAAIANNAKDSNERIQIVPEQKGIFKLVYLKRSDEDVKVSIIDEQGEIIRQEDVMAEDGFLENYDLRQQGTGIYTFRVKDLTGHEDHHLYYNREMGLVICQMGNTGKYKLTVENIEESFDIEIYNDKEQLIRREKIRSGKSIKKVFNISKIMDVDETVIFKIKEGRGLLKVATFQ